MAKDAVRLFISEKKIVRRTAFKSVGQGHRSCMSSHLRREGGYAFSGGDCGRPPSPLGVDRDFSKGEI